MDVKARTPEHRAVKSSSSKALPSAFIDHSGTRSLSLSFSLPRSLSRSLSFSASLLLRVSLLLR